MARKIRMSAIHVSVLRRIAGTMSPGARMEIADFADIATSPNERERWAKDPLASLHRKGFVEPVETGARKRAWRITLEGAAFLASEDAVTA